MPTEPTDPITFSVAECASAFGVSTDTVLRMVHGGGLEAIQVGRRVMVLRQSVADLIARALDPKDERRKAVDEFDGILAADAAAARKQAAEQEADRKVRLSPAGQRATARRLQKEREAADPNYGTANSRISVVNFRKGRKDQPISDSAVSAEDLVGADPNRGKVPGARVGYVIDKKQVPEFTGKALPRFREEVNQ